MGQVSRHPLIVMADSDVAVGPNYLRTLAGALAQSGVGVVTCLYRGLPRPASGRDCFPWQCTIISCPARSWARARPGPAMRWRDHCFVAGHSNQDRGLQAAANQLADDYAIGQAVRQAGLRVVVPPMLVAHTFEEKSLSDLMRHELRWARTIFTVDPLGHIASSVTHALPLAVIGAALRGFDALGLAAILSALACRLFLKDRLTREFELPNPDYALLVARDMLSFVLYFASFWSKRVRWRGQDFAIAPDGTLLARVERRVGPHLLERR